MTKRSCLTTFLPLTLTILLTGCAVPSPQQIGEPAETAEGEVAFDLAGPGGVAMVVPVKINGEGPFDFVLDTGATFTCIDQRFAEEMNLPQQGGQIGIGVGIESQGQVKLVRIDTLQVGTAQASDLSACVIDLRQAQSLGLDVKGLLGLNFLKSYRVTIDFSRKVVQLQKPELSLLRD